MNSNITLLHPAAPTQQGDRLRQRLLGVRLQRLYADTATAQTPDSFIDLLQQADRLRRN